MGPAVVQAEAASDRASGVAASHGKDHWGSPVTGLNFISTFALSSVK